MPIKLIYSYTSSSLLLVIITGLANIIINLFIIKASKNQPEKVKNTNILLFAGSINVVFILFVPLVPEMILDNFSINEYQLYKLYSLVQSLLVPLSTLISSGLSFFVFGRVNRKYFDSYLLVSGMLMILSTMLNIVSLLLYDAFMFDLIFLNPDVNFQGSSIWIVRVVLSNLEMTTYGLSMILYFFHARLNKDKYIMRSILSMIFLSPGMYFVYYIIVNIFGL